MMIKIPAGAGAFDAAMASLPSELADRMRAWREKAIAHEDAEYIPVDTEYLPRQGERLAQDGTALLFSVPAGVETAMAGSKGVHVPIGAFRDIWKCVLEAAVEPGSILPEADKPPASLSDGGVRIPEALRGCRFIKVRAGGKEAIEKGWQETRNYAADDPEILRHLAAGGNYGVIPNGGICILDADEAPRMLEMLEPFIDTFTVRTGGDGVKFHFYFRCPGLEGKVPFYDITDGTHLGEVYGSGARAYCVGPGCLHPSGRRYEVATDAPVREISLEDLDRFFAKVKCSRSEKRTVPRVQRVPTVGGTISDKLGLRCEEFLMPESPTVAGDEIRGAHPIHGSSSGSNLHINVKDNCWHCKRCNAGGGPLEALAVAEGIIECSDSGHGCLDGHWSEVFEALRARGHNVISQKDTRAGIVLWKSRSQIPDVRLKEDLARIARAMKAQSMSLEDALAKISTINASKRVNTAVDDGQVIEIVEAAYGALTVQEAFRETDTAIRSHPEITDRALEILKTGSPLQFFHDTFATIHSGDVPVLDTILCGAAVQAAVNTKGIQPALNGPRGAGKTSGARAAVHLFPQEYVFTTSLTSKALFYDRRLMPGCIVFSDDTELEAGLLSTIKRAMSFFQEETEHLTVDKGPGNENVARALCIPPRQMFLFTAVGDTGDDQLNDRQFMLSIDQTPGAEAAYDDFLKEQVKEGRQEYPVTEEVLVCQEILRFVKSHLFRVKIPYADAVKFRDCSKKRNMGTFFDFIMASAILKFLQRKHSLTEGDPEDIVTITATVEDFHTARSIFKTNEDTRAYDLNREERALLDWIVEHADGFGLPEPDIIRGYSREGKSRNSTRAKIRRLLYGRDGSPNTITGGLLAKVPGMTVEMQTRRIGEEVKKTVNVISTPPWAKSGLDDFADWVSLDEGMLPDPVIHTCTAPDPDSPETHFEEVRS